jgi:hypothetical protein
VNFCIFFNASNQAIILSFQTYSADPASALNSLCLENAIRIIEASKPNNISNTITTAK